VRRWRWVGLAGSVLVAAAAYVIGANVGPAPAGPVALSTRPGHLLALAGWLVGAAALVTAWLAVARRAERVPPRWLVTTGALWAVPLLLGPPLGSRDIFAYACQGAAYAHGLDPYTLGAQGPACPWTDAVPALWRTSPAPYGPLWLLLSGAAARAAGTSLWAAVVAFRVLALAGLLLAGWCLRPLARLCEVPAGTALWLGMLSPLVLVHAVSGAHNDALATGLVLAGLAVAGAARGAAAGGRWWALAAGCGALFALALAVKVVAVVAAPFAVLLLARPGARRPAAAVPPFLAGAAAAYAALWAGTGLGFGWVSGLRPTTSLAQWTSLPTGLGMAVGYLLRLFGVPHGYPTAVAVARVLGALVLAGVLVALWWRARRAAQPGEVLRLTGAALVAAVLLGPVFYPWYALTPLAVLAACADTPRVRTGVAAGTATLVFLVFPDGYGLAVATKLPGALLDVALVIAAAVWLARRHRAGTPFRFG
jgi:alpha-1,6-mannosyltransferase